MRPKLHHEIIYRGKAQIEKLAATKILVLGAGALGSNLVTTLARQGFCQLTVLDKDRVEEQNLSTQVYAQEDVGAIKADILANIVYRDLGEEIKPIAQELTEKNVSKYLTDYALVIDSFDNSVSRKVVSDHCRDKGINCLHVGVNGDFGEVRWNENYIVPSDAGDDICDYPLARNLILLMTAVASETIIRFILDNRKESYSITLRDLSINLDGLLE
ncbi:MAG: ThiF family adenylyltransferase [Cyanobacteria bacterium]|nr:ThiF family adenylyltransferase [Cyanobacteriota bacterium]